MEKVEIGKKYIIHSYKHNGRIYKAWDEAVLLSYNRKEGIYIFGNKDTQVTEADGRNWSTKEPAILFFFTNHWYNIIAQCKKSGLYFYCNIASPMMIEEGAIKYIDYDLDVKVFPDGSFKILDRKEYYYHKKKMAYPEEIDNIIKKELNHLIEQIRKKNSYFNQEIIRQYQKKYEEIKKKS